MDKRVENDIYAARVFALTFLTFKGLVTLLWVKHVTTPLTKVNRQGLLPSMLLQHFVQITHGTLALTKRYKKVKLCAYFSPFVVTSKFIKETGGKESALGQRGRVECMNAANMGIYWIKMHMNKKMEEIEQRARDLGMFTP